MIFFLPLNRPLQLAVALINFRTQPMLGSSVLMKLYVSLLSVSGTREPPILLKHSKHWYIGALYSIECFCTIHEAKYCSCLIFLAFFNYVPDINSLISYSFVVYGTCLCSRLYDTKRTMGIFGSMPNMDAQKNYECYKRSSTIKDRKGQTSRRK